MIENQGKQKHFEQSTEPKNKQNHNTKKLIEKKRRQKYREKKDVVYVHIVTTFTSDSTMDTMDLFTLFLP